MKKEDITHKIIGAAYKVFNTLGFGFLESVYKKAMVLELRKQNMAVKEEQPLKVYYEDSVFGEGQVLARGVKIYFCYRYTGKMLKEIGRHFDIGASGVSQTSRRIALKISQDNKLRGKIRKIENKLKLSVPPLVSLQKFYKKMIQTIQ